MSEVTNVSSLLRCSKQTCNKHVLQCSGRTWLAHALNGKCVCIADAELRRIAEEEAEQAKQTKAALQKLEVRHTADAAGTSATATAAATPSDSATVLSTEVPPASVNPTAAATNVPMGDCDGGKQEQVSQPQQQERQKQQQQSQHPHVSSPVADKEPAGPPPQLDYSQIMQSLEAMTPRELFHAYDGLKLVIDHMHRIHYMLINTMIVRTGF